MLLFLSGWPACGETAYGEWLATSCNFRHIDLESDRSHDPEWTEQWRRLSPERARSFASYLQKKHPRWVLTGQVPADDLPRLESLQAAGFALWFLQARSEGLSRQRWLMLEREIDPAVRPLAWEKQADAIRSSARQLRPIFRDRCVTTLRSVTELMDGAEFATHIGVTPKA